MERLRVGRRPHHYSSNWRRCACHSGARASKSRLHSNRRIARWRHEPHHSHRKGGYASCHQHIAGTIFEHRAKSWRRCRRARWTRARSFQSPARLVNLCPRYSNVLLLRTKNFARYESEDLALMEKIEWTGRSYHTGKTTGRIASEPRVHF